jgi:hypothetical protein
MLSGVAVAIVTARCSVYGSNDDASLLAGDAGDEAAPGTADASDEPDAGAGDAGTDGDAGCLDPCDCDGDEAKSPSCDPDVGAADCDDFDPRIRPGQGFVADPWPDASGHAPAGDWNCDGKVRRELPVGVSCATASPCPSPGFVGDPPCGSAGPFITCASILGLGCSDGKTESRVQRCK